MEEKGTRSSERKKMSSGFLFFLLTNFSYSGSPSHLQESAVHQPEGGVQDARAHTESVIYHCSNIFFGLIKLSSVYLSYQFQLFFPPNGAFYTKFLQLFQFVYF